MNDEIYYYKGKPYRILEHIRIKVNGKWEDGIRYECLYFNPDGKVWHRLKDDFFDNFKPQNDKANDKATV